MNRPRRTTLRLLRTTGLLLLSWTSGCRADGTWSASVGATTDYIFRGVSQTYDSGALQLGGNYQNSQGWFVGAWGSNVDPYPHAGGSAELDLYAGVTRPIGADFSARLAYTHYSYLDDPRPSRYDYDEISVSAAYLDRIAATLSYQPDTTGDSNFGYAGHHPSGAFELTSRWPIWRDLSLTAGVGYYDLQRLFGVSYWAGNVGVSYVYRRLTLELNHYFADDTVRRLYSDQSANGTWTFSGVLRF
jgi:uncharacterized protein (TIGR02001 family)